MLHGLSRTALNIIIIVCLLLISWIHLSQKDVENEPLEPLQLPSLNSGEWTYWTNNEGVSVLLRAGGNTDGGWLLLRGQQKSQPLFLPASNWADALRPQLASLPGKEEAAAVVISGPWPVSEQQAMAALVIQQQQLHGGNGSRQHWDSCLRQHSAGALWLADQLSLPWYKLAQLTRSQAETLSPPARTEWADWRLQRSRELRRQWQDEQGLIDIQADLAYHRLPDGTYQALYQSLADAQKTEVTEAMHCLPSQQGSPNE